MRDLAPGVLASASTWQQPLPTRCHPQRDRFLRDIASGVAGLTDQRILIGIDGRTAAGKTTFGHELGVRVAELGRPVLRASLDDFKRPWRDRHFYDRETGEGYYRNAFDHDAIVNHLLVPGSSAGTGRVALCSIDPLTQVDHSASRVEAPEDAVLIVDGVFAFRPEMNGYWALRIWLDVDPQTSAHRGIARDEAGWADSQAARIYQERYRPSEELYLQEVDPRGRADLIIDHLVFDRPQLAGALGSW